MSLTKNFDIPLTFVSLHFSKCPVVIREYWVRIFQDSEHRRKFHKLLRHNRKISPLEMVWIPTCNRCDVAMMGHILPTEFQEALFQFCEAEGIPHIQGDSFMAHGVFFHGHDALFQLMRVASSLDSLVLGESQILGQLKESYALSVREGLGANKATKVFQACFHAAKRVRKETQLGYHGVSIGHAAVQMVLKVFDVFDKLNILVIGSGQMARIAAQHALSQGARKVTVANRTLLNAENLARRLGCQTQSMSLGDALKTIQRWDVILVATASPTPLLCLEHFSLRARALSQVIVDMSIPRNVDNRIAHLEDVFLFDVDSLQGVLFENRSLREQAAQKAEVIIKEEVFAFQKSINKRKQLQSVGKFHQLVYQIVEQEVNKSLRKGKVESQIIARAVAKKLTAGPILAAKEIDSPLEKSPNDSLSWLFSLTEKPRIGQAETPPHNRDAS